MVLKRIFLYGVIFLFLNVNLAYANAKNDIEKQVDHVVISSMQKYRVPAISLAIIDHDHIVYTKAYSLNPNLIITNKSLFQSASIGKSVAAYGLLSLVDDRKIALDENVNNFLKSWKVSENNFTQKNKVTVRNILDMTSGLSVPGFLGSHPDEPIPTLKEILKGEKPAENGPIVVSFVPGSQYFYSGGSYEVLEQLIEDVTHTSFSDYMNKSILMPLNMTDSQYIALLPQALQAKAVPGFLKNGDMISGKWKIIPALAAGGMWTTPTDLAKFAINVTKSYRGAPPDGLLSKGLAKTMLARQKNTDFGLGVVIEGCGKSLNFRKEGHNIGFYSWLLVFPNTGQGIVIMTNSENGMLAIQSIISKIGQLYQWPKYYPIVDESQRLPELNAECT